MMASVRHLNPTGLPQNPAFTQAVAVAGPVTTVYVGGQNGVGPSGDVVGRGDLKAQTVQALRNLETALSAAGATLDQVVKWGVYVVSGQPVQTGSEGFQQVWGRRPNPPAITVLFVAGLAHPDCLVEIDAVAVVPLA
jgi:enamine deaminase RidA (YjgF/YER057c/UK114 family)